MAHFAKINENNTVTEVIVIDNKDIMINDVESEKAGQDFIANVLGLDGKWLQTSYNKNFRGAYAAIGFFYDEGTDKFISLEQKSKWTAQMPIDYKKNISKKTILVDGFPRSGNVYLSYVLAHAFPETDQFTGYGFFHNIDSITVSKDMTDCIFVAVRNPIDSIKSLININNVDNPSEDLLFRLSIQNLEWMKKIQSNKDNVCIVDFDKLVNNLDSVVSNAAKNIQQLPVPITEENIKEIMLKDNLQYNLPNETSSKEVAITNNLTLSVIEEATGIYNSLVN